MDAKEKLIRDTLGLKLPGAGRKNYSVKAGAGGGKTTLLSQRICNQLLLGTPIEEFVIITYTNAAAAELREKITVRLQQLIREGIPDALQRENAGKALNTVELMQVSTIHAFLFKLLRENAFESGVVTDAKMLEDFEDRARRTKFFDAWYHMHFDEMKAFATDWVLSTSRGYKTDHTREVFENMFHDLANVREEVVYDTSDHSAALAKEAKDYVTYWLPVLRNFKSEFINNQPRKKDKAGTPYKWLKGPQEIIDAISLTEGRNACGIEEACILSKALSGIKKIVDKGDNFYYNGLEPNWKLSSVIPDFSGGELDWNFSKFYEEFVVNAEKAAKVVEYVCKMREEYQKQID
ncbi:MAG: UvrD-helicase domain-containing protein [Lachnospiraceae bacterium]|nr:UvrD-helicase domain-containing protein [Lachnospiraceae bacterium]